MYFVRHGEINIFDNRPDTERICASRRKFDRLHKHVTVHRNEPKHLAVVLAQILPTAIARLPRAYECLFFFWMFWPKSAQVKSFACEIVPLPLPPPPPQENARAVIFFLCSKNLSVGGRHACQYFQCCVDFLLPKYTVQKCLHAPDKL